MPKTSTLEQQVARWGGWRGTTPVDELKVALGIVKEARLTGGPKAVVEVWEQLPLPPLKAFQEWQVENFPHYDFLRNEVVHVPGARTPVAEIYAAYEQWCDTAPICQAVSKIAFGLAVTETFGRSIRSRGTGNVHVYDLIPIEAPIEVEGPDAFASAAMPAAESPVWSSMLHSASFSFSPYPWGAGT